MKLILVCVLLMCIVASVLGAGCNFNGHEFKVGEQYSPIGACIQYTCTSEDGSLSAINCPVSTAPNCKVIPEDLSKPYPQCCEAFKC